MPADRMLNTLLQLYQDVHDDAKTEQIIGTTTHLLTQLSNPLNLGVLTSQLLTAPAIWMRPGGLRTSLRIISIYNSAAMRVLQLQNDIVAGNPLPPNEAGGGLRCDEWARAAVKGADDRSNRWQHLLVLTGILLGMESNERRGLSRGLRNTLGQAVATAANLALQTAAEEGPLAQGSIVLALNFAFPLLGEHHRNQINCNALLPAAVWALVGEEGFADGQFLLALARDTVDTLGQGISWSPQSPSFQELLMMDKSPLMANMGPLSKLASFAAERATETGVVLQAHNDLLTFSHRVLNAWAKTRFSDVDPALESTRLSRETLEQTWPALWQVLRKVMFGTVAVLQAIVSRSLLDPYMLHDTAAPGIASVSLQILRNLYFISSRNGNGSFQVYEFSYLASLDNITRSSRTCEAFLADFRTAEGITLPSGFLQRTLDLFYLNVAEHMPLVLSTEACDALIIKPATSYLSLDGPMTPAVVEIFESSHSAILAVMSCPQHSRLTIELAPFYIVKLFESFPHQISPRQFRLAFKTVIQIVSPPFPIASLEPHLSETLLEMLLAYTANAATVPLPQSEASMAASEESGGAAPESAQSALVLTLIDALPFLPLAYMEEWLTAAAKSLNSIADPRLRQPVRDRFWDILVNGEMDVERAAVGVAWWGTKGGREMVLQGTGATVPMMSGAIVTEDKASRL